MFRACRVGLASLDNKACVLGLNLGRCQQRTAFKLNHRLITTTKKNFYILKLYFSCEDNKNKKHLFQILFCRVEGFGHEFDDQVRQLCIHIYFVFSSFSYMFIIISRSSHTTTNVIILGREIKLP